MADTMTGAGFRAWREAAGWDQKQAAEALGISRMTISRAEKAQGDAIGPKLAEAVAALGGMAGVDAPAPAPIQSRASPAPKARQSEAKAQPATPKGEGSKPLHLRTFGRTAGECRAIREAKALKLDKGGRTVGVPLVPLIPEWATVGRRIVNAAIPSPLDRAPPPWAGPRGVVSADGAVYDYETAHRMTPFG
jgi:transcriptional regulator with XRE-family HTH domain